MKKMSQWIVAFGSMLFAFTLLLYIIPQIFSVVLFLLTLVVVSTLVLRAVFVGWSEWRQASRLWPLPALAGLFFLLCSLYEASPLSQRISDSFFGKHIGEYSAVVERFRTGSLRCTDGCEAKIGSLEVTTRLATEANIWGAHCSGNEVVVLFIRKVKVPLLHEGYMFRDDANAGCSKESDAQKFISSRLFYVRHIAGHWYRVSNRPGF